VLKKKHGLMCSPDFASYKGFAKNRYTFELERNPDKSDTYWFNTFNAGIMIIDKKLVNREVFEGLLSNLSADTYADLKNLYSGALAFFQHRQDIHAAFSSREAQLCKVPVIHCSEAPEDELLAFGFLKKACDSEEISESMRLLHSDKKLRNELAEKSYKSTLHMSLRKTISETLSVYKQIAIQ
jgi:hypothetical protein